MKRIRTLDGWRGVAIGLVLLEHTAFYGPYHGRTWATQGGRGVDVFFVVSGYIITSRLLEERQAAGTVSLKNFYIRRAARIVPPVLAYLLAIIVLNWLIGLIDFHWSEIWAVLLFLRNYQYAHVPGPGSYTGHFWSLAIEEHFYLFWPALLLWLGNRRAAWVAGSGALCCALWRLYDYSHDTTAKLFPRGWVSPFFRTDVRLDGLLIGSMLAVLLTNERVRAFIFGYFPKELPILGTLLVVIVSQMNSDVPSLRVYCIMATMIAGTLIVEEGLAHKVLNWPVLVWIGQISYGLYVWQQIFLMRPSSGIARLGPFSVFPLNLVCAFSAATLSYYFLEKPIINFAKRALKREPISEPHASAAIAPMPLVEPLIESAATASSAAQQ